MKLSTWIEKLGGAHVAAEKLKVTTDRVRSWLRHTATPRPVVMKAIVALTRGQVSYAEIIDETLSNRKPLNAKPKTKVVKKVKAAPKRNSAAPSLAGGIQSTQPGLGF